MKKNNIKLNNKYFVGVDPNGNIIGPCGLDKDYIKQCMVAEFSRKTGNIYDNEDDLWDEFEHLGYSVKKGKIIIELYKEEK